MTAGGDIPAQQFFVVAKQLKSLSGESQLLSELLMKTTDSWYYCAIGSLES